MKNRTFAAALAAVLLASAARASLPTGSFQGNTLKVLSPNVMSLIIRQDPSDSRVHYAILAEYTRLPFIPDALERLEVTRWVPRIYIYRVEPAGERRYALKPLRATPSGEIEVDSGYYATTLLELAKPGTLRDASLIRYDKGSSFAAETVIFNGRPVSTTWEGYVPGKYFGSKDSTGGDYLHKQVNSILSEDMVADFQQEDIQGRYDVVEKLPKIFVLRPKGAAGKGAVKAQSLIGVFIDIVNWKPFMTTDEFMLINPDDAKDVGFFYERH